MLSSVSASTPVVVSDSDDDDDNSELCSVSDPAVDAIEVVSEVGVEGDESFFTMVGSVRAFFALARSFLSAFYKKGLKKDYI